MNAIDAFFGTLTFFGVFSSVCLLIFFYAFLIEPHILMTTHKTATFPFGGLRIALIGDFHVGPFKRRGFVERVVRKTNALQPDIVFIVGDFLFNRMASPKPLAALSELKSTYGTFAVLGNHENGHVLRHMLRKNVETYETPLVQTLRSAGITTLHNESTVITLKDGKQLCIIGIEDLWSGLDDLQSALKNVPPSMPSILLSHNPDIILDVDSRRADLIMSGHTHAGQIIVPFWGPLYGIPQEIGPTFDHGVFALSDNTELVITRGVGESTLPFRFRAPPEVMIVTTQS